MTTTLADVVESMRYTDLRRRLMECYNSHSAGIPPHEHGDPHQETKVAHKLATYTPEQVRELLACITHDLGLSPLAHLDLAEYAAYLITDTQGTNAA